MNERCYLCEAWKELADIVGGPVTCPKHRRPKSDVRLNLTRSADIGLGGTDPAIAEAERKLYGQSLR